MHTLLSLQDLEFKLIFLYIWVLFQRLLEPMAKCLEEPGVSAIAEA